MEKNVCIDFLYDVAAAFRETYAASLEETNAEVFEDFEAQIEDLMEEFGRSVLEPGKLGRVDRMRNKQFCGLRDVDGCFLHVREHQVDVSVHGPCAKVEISKDYINETKAPVEVFFTFKEDNVTVVSFEVTRDEEEQSSLYSVCAPLKSDLAFVVREVTKGGRAAFLLEEADDSEGLNVYVGNVEPGSSIKCKLKYVAQLEMSGSLLELFLPSTRVWGDLQASVFALSISVDMMSNIEELTCASGHQIDCEKSGPTGIVIVDSDELLKVNAELLLFIGVENPHAPMLMVEKATVAKPYVTLCLGWNPLFKANLAEDTPSEFVFLVDRGKSMQGRKLTRIKSALSLWLHSLPCGCTFNIIGFAETAVIKLYDTSQAYFDGTLRQAMSYVRDMEADPNSSGGLSTALQQAFANPQLDDGRTKQLFVLLSEDSGADRPEDILPIVANGSKTARVYSFALGPRSNQSLARRIAKVASGFYEYLPSDQFLEAAVVDRVVRSSGPALGKVSIDWGVPGASDQTPSSLPCIFSDNRNLFVGYAIVPVNVLRTEKEIKATVHGRVSSLVDGREVATRDVEVASAAVALESSVTSNDVLALNWKVRMLSGLRWEWMGASSGAEVARLRTRLLTEATNANIHMEGITELQVMNGNTKKVDSVAKVIPNVDSRPAVKARDAPVKYVAEPIAAPGVNISKASLDAAVSPRSGGTSGGGKEKKGGLWSWWRGDEGGKGSSSSSAADGGGSSRSSSATSTTTTSTGEPKASKRETRLFSLPLENLVDESDREPFLKEADDLDQFLWLQRSNGRWLCDSVFITFLSAGFELSSRDLTTPPTKMKQDLKSLTPQQQSDVWGTAIAVQVLQKCFPDMEPNWAGMCAKAKGYLFRVIKRHLGSSGKEVAASAIAAEARGYLEMAGKVVKVPGADNDSRE